jgi:hypothetical protein
LLFQNGDRKINMGFRPKFRSLIKKKEKLKNLVNITIPTRTLQEL